MTNKELRKALESYPDDAKVRFTLVCDNSFRKIDNIRYVERNKIIALESNDVPDEDDLKCMIEESLKTKRDYISSRVEALFEEVLDES
jgi:hypothetical protein